MGVKHINKIGSCTMTVVIEYIYIIVVNQIAELLFISNTIQQNAKLFSETSGVCIRRVRKLPRATTNVQKNKSYVGFFISYVGLFISYVGLIKSYVGLYNSYVGDKIS